MRRIRRQRLGAVLLMALLCSCTGRTTSEPFVRNVCLTSPVVLDEESTRIYAGIVKAAHEVSLGFKTAGQITRINVSEGDYVQQGQLLAELDDADYRLAVEALQIQYDQLKDEVARTKQLFEQKSVSANDFEKASAGLRQLGVQLQANRNKLDYTKLYAPTDGYIQAVNFSPAEMVDAGTALFTLLDVSHLEVEVSIPVREYLQRDRFAGFTCRATGLKSRMPMRLGGITPKADGTQLYQLTLTFAENPDRRLTAGMNVEVGITVADTARTHSFGVPSGAVFMDGNVPCVWVFRADSTIERRPVTLHDMDNEGRIVVIDGLTGGEQIVRTGVSALEEGEKVRVVSTPSQTNAGGLL